MRSKMILMCSLLVIAGCVPSLHSIVTEKTQVYDPDLNGQYRMEDADWTITGDPNQKSYSIAIEEKEGKQSMLVAELAKIDGHYFLDMYPSQDAELNTGDWFNAHIIGVHCFWKLEKTQAGYTIASLDPDTIKALLADKPQMVKHEVVEDERVVLTDTPENLQKFLISGLKIDEFYGDTAELKRVNN